MRHLTRRQILLGASVAVPVAACGGRAANEAAQPLEPTDAGLPGDDAARLDVIAPDASAGTDSAANAGAVKALSRPGVVIEVAHPGAVVNHVVQAAAVQQIMKRAMLELTGKATETDAWRAFFGPSDVVAIKVNPFGYPSFFSQIATVAEVIRGLNLAGVTNANIIVYDRYTDYLAQVGYPAALPAGVRFGGAVVTTAEQTALTGYDAATFVDLPRVADGLDPTVALNRRSHLCDVVSKEVTKVVNVPVLKDHWTAGVTCALKNMTYGLVNNTARSHDGESNWTIEFLPAVASMQKLRDKVVLHVADLLIACYDGGPDPSPSTFEYGALVLGSDPVAIDRVCLEILERQRAKMSLPAVATLPGRQAQYIERCGAAGLGISDLAKITHRTIVV